ncbi:MAG: hypothetical protein JXR96_18440 [Deltaproteobacteria bacterium]|nr:hypothetical protein [Deltaproteobacteria bacterium]
MRIEALLRSRPVELVLAAIAFCLGARFVPSWWCAREAPAWVEGRAEVQLALARAVDSWIQRDLERADFHTGSARFDGEWLFGSYVMAGMGFGQIALAHPELGESMLPRMRRCARAALSARARRFDAQAWGEDPLQALDREGSGDHAAYLGYLNLLLGLLVRLDPASEFAALHARVSGFLAARLAASPIGLLQTYPGEVYPVDNAAVVGSLGMRGSDHLRAWASRHRSQLVDPESGLLFQRVDARSGEGAGLPRGSHTALAVYFSSFADPDLACELFDALRAELAGSVLGFGMLREAPEGVDVGWGDIDSGPVLFGRSISATGFAIGASRICGDEALFARLLATAWLFGAPHESGGALELTSGGPLGNALLLAMLTAPAARPAEERP